MNSHLLTSRSMGLRDLSAPFFLKKKKKKELKIRACPWDAIGH